MSSRRPAGGSAKRRLLRKVPRKLPAALTPSNPPPAPPRLLGVNLFPTNRELAPGLRKEGGSFLQAGGGAGGGGGDDYLLPRAASLIKAPGCYK